MAAFFASASSQRLVKTSIAITAYPFTVGFIAVPTTNGAARTWWSLSDTGTTNNYYLVRQNATNSFQLTARGGGTENSTTGAAVVINEQYCVIARFINATSRWLDILRMSQGTETHNQATTSRTATGLDEEDIGALNTSGGVTELLDGGISEFWVTNADVQPDGASMQSPLLRQLAYGGPFSVPHIAKDIVEYRSFRKDPLVGDVDDLFFGALGQQNWANTNGVSTSPHPPLPYWYEKPGQRHTTLII